ncbi:MAG: MarR family transcriptional regulator [Lachnospiraceae bacterium]|nr:MarR family transcriptional regulator [Lachnospiraceae bacterium]
MAICNPWEQDSLAGAKRYSDEQLAEFGNILSMNKILMLEFSNRQRAEGAAVRLSEYEAHILLLIRQNPGITSVCLAKKISRTKSTISSLIYKFCTAGYVIKEVNPKNRREHCLTLTSFGEQICADHQRRDAQFMRITLEKLFEYCTPEEFETFIRVTQIRNQIFSNEPPERGMDRVWGC